MVTSVFYPQKTQVVSVSSIVMLLEIFENSAKPNTVITHSSPLAAGSIGAITDALTLAVINQCNTVRALHLITLIFFN